MRGLTRAVLDFVSTEASSLEHSRVLDYGCGVMPYRTAFGLVGAEVIGVDIGENNSAQVKIDGKAGLPFTSDQFDYAVSFQVLEHIPAPSEYLAETYRVLKDGGKLFLTTHGAWPYHPTPGDFHRWTRQGLVSELEREGFQVTTIRCILNDYSAAVQTLVMSAHYRGALRGFERVTHLLTHMLIACLERLGRHEPQIPAVVCVVGVKR